MGLSPDEMQSAIVKNLKSKTGKSLEEWLEVLRLQQLKDKKSMMHYLKEQQQVGHFQAQTIIKHFQASNT